MKFFQSKLSICLSAMCFLLFLTCSNPLTHGHGAGGDIALFSTNGQVDVGFAILDDDDIDQEFFDPNENVFSLVLLPLAQPNPIAPWEFASTEPGFDANEGELPPDADISYNLLELLFWDGSDPSNVSFAPATGILGGTSPGGKSFPSGGFHSHPYFGVADPNGSPAEGVYVGKMTVSVEGLTDSEPYYMVSLVTNAVTSLPIDEQVAVAEEIGEMARSFAEDPIGNPAPLVGGTDFTFFANAINHVRVLAVPEPGSITLAGLALLGLSIGRKRQG